MEGEERVTEGSGAQAFATCGTIGLSFKHFGRRCLGHPGGAQTRTATVARLELEPFVTRLRCQDLLRPLQRL